MKIVTIYMKRGCPYCQKVENFVNNNDLKDNVNMYYAGEDFDTGEFKKKYNGSTFPRGFIVEDKKNPKDNKLYETVELIEGGSDEILKVLGELEKEESSDESEDE